jgi:hypothetical protein
MVSIHARVRLCVCLCLRCVFAVSFWGLILITSPTPPNIFLNKTFLVPLREVTFCLFTPWEKSWYVNRSKASLRNEWSVDGGNIDSVLMHCVTLLQAYTVCVRACVRAKLCLSIPLFAFVTDIQTAAFNHAAVENCIRIPATTWNRTICVVHFHNLWARSQSCEKRVILALSCPCVSARNNFAPTGRILMKLDIRDFFSKMCLENLSLVNIRQE